MGMQIDYLVENERPLLFDNTTGEIIKFNNIDELEEACKKLGRNILDFSEEDILSEFEYHICNDWDNEDGQVEKELNKIKKLFISSENLK